MRGYQVTTGLAQQFVADAVDNKEPSSPKENAPETTQLNVIFLVPTPNYIPSILTCCCHCPEVGVRKLLCTAAVNDIYLPGDEGALVRSKP